MIIALIGNDGSGKTELASAVAEKLRKAGLDVDCRQGGNYFLLARLQRLFPRETVRRSQHDFRHEGRRKPFLFRLWPYLVYLDCLALYLAIKLRNRRQIILMDRYFYHHAIGYEYHGYSNRLIRRLFFSLPRPHVAIVLDAPAEIAYERKKADDASLDYYLAQRQRYLELARSMGITTVSTEQPFASSLSAVWAQVKKALPGRLPEEIA